MDQHPVLRDATSPVLRLLRRLCAAAPGGDEFVALIWRIWRWLCARRQGAAPATVGVTLPLDGCNQAALAVDDDDGGSSIKNRVTDDEDDGGSSIKNRVTDDEDDGGSSIKNRVTDDEDDGGSSVKNRVTDHDDGGGSSIKNRVTDDEDDGDSSVKNLVTDHDDGGGSYIKNRVTDDEDDGGSSVKNRVTDDEDDGGSSVKNRVTDHDDGGGSSIKNRVTDHEDDGDSSVKNRVTDDEDGGGSYVKNRVTDHDDGGGSSIKNRVTDPRDGPSDVLQDANLAGPAALGIIYKDKNAGKECAVGTFKNTMIPVQKPPALAPWGSNPTVRPPARAVEDEQEKCRAMHLKYVEYCSLLKKKKKKTYCLACFIDKEKNLAKKKKLAPIQNDRNTILQHMHSRHKPGWDERERPGCFAMASTPQDIGHHQLYAHLM